MYAHANVHLQYTMYVICHMVCHNYVAWNLLNSNIQGSKGKKHYLHVYIYFSPPSTPLPPLSPPPLSPPPSPSTPPPSPLSPPPSPLHPSPLPPPPLTPAVLYIGFLPPPPGQPLQTVNESGLIQFTLASSTSNIGTEVTVAITSGLEIIVCVVLSFNALLLWLYYSAVHVIHILGKDLN